MSKDTKEKLKNSSARIAIIDADSVLYAVALSAEALSKGSGITGMMNGSR